MNYQVILKTNRFVFLLFVAMFFFMGKSPSGNSYTLSKGYSVTITGTSNLHDWSQKVNLVSGEAEVTQNSNGNFEIADVKMRLSVYSIKSEKGSIMDKNTYKALKAESYPEITFALKIPLSVDVKSVTSNVSVKGNLFIAGISRSVNLMVRSSGKTTGTLNFEGQYLLKMTDFGVSPPVALLGRLKTGDEVTIKFKVQFTKKP